MISHMLLQTLGGPQFKKKMVKISPAHTFCLPGLAAGWLYVKELEMWFQQGICVAILRKDGSVTLPRKMRSSINEQEVADRSQCPFCGWGLLLGSYPYVDGTLGVPPGTLSVGTLRSRGTGWGGRQSHLHADESVGFPFALSPSTAAPWRRSSH